MSRFKSISQQLRKKREKYDKRLLLAKVKLNTIEVLNYKALTDSYIILHEFILVNNVFKEYNYIKEEIKYLG